MAAGTRGVVVICKDRVVIVTGAGRGLGRAHALALAEAGACVVVNDLGASLRGDGTDEGPAVEVAAEITARGGRAIAHAGDITDWAVGAELVALAVETWGELHAVVNNAGIVRDRMFVSSEAAEWEAVLKVHVMGHVATTRHACAHWRQRAKEGRTVDARIVNTTSGAGLQGSIGQAAYSTAKGGIASLTLVQAAELARYGVTANAIAPAARTRMTEEVFAEAMRAPEEGFDAMDPANVSPLVTWLCSEASRAVSGRVFEVQGGRIALSDGWRELPGASRDARWSPEELSDIVPALLAAAPTPPKVYGT
ncbi:MAG: SDR family NAD(P)-dependent oxidoreductase [Alphaproteobacteria bacterium]|nr:SDR family NAD(P)-dependent oxidoreductase [Alphaproteobacteria bacterium]